MDTRGGSVRLFENDWLERLSRVHPITPLLLWAPVIVWLLWRAVVVHRMEPGVLVELAVAGVVVWTLTEYVIHRFLFHHRARSTVGARLVFVVHGIHHASPDDPMRLVMPPVPAIVASAAFFAMFRALLGSPSVEPFFAFFLMGYLAYDYVHLAVHRVHPRTRIGRFLRRWHMQHHHVTPEARWGVSSPMWDHVFRTTGRTVTAARPR